MRYVIVSVVNGEAGEFNNRLRKEVWQEMKAKSSKLPAHFTIKAPFEHDGSIQDLEQLLEEFVKNHKAYPYIIDGFGHFDNRVVFMNVCMSAEGKLTHDQLIDELDKIDYLDFSRQDGKDKVFHVTVASKRIQPIYEKLWSYVNELPCRFDCQFDNITIYRWEDYTWVMHRQYQLVPTE